MKLSLEPNNLNSNLRYLCHCLLFVNTQVIRIVFSIFEFFASNIMALFSLLNTNITSKHHNNVEGRIASISTYSGNQLVEKSNNCYKYSLMTHGQFL